MLSNKPAIDFKKFKITGEEEFITIAVGEENVLDSYIETYGIINRCGIYFKKNETEYIATAGFFSNHDDARNLVSEEANFFIDHTDTPTSKYGFVTNKNIFVSRQIAAVINEELRISAKQDTKKLPHSLYSYNVAWNLCITAIKEQEKIKA